MKVLMQSRKSHFLVPGGDTVQITKTKEYLEKRGIKVDISLDLNHNLSDYDIIHLFNITRPQELFLHVKNAIKYDKRIALTPIFVDYSEYDKKARIGFARILANIFTHSQNEYFKVAARAILNKEYDFGTLNLLMKGYRNCQNDILNSINVILPNSNSEFKRLNKHFKISSKIPSIIVPNAIDVNIFDNKMVVNDPAVLKYKNCILCVARIEGLKNQLNIVRAMKNTNIKVVFIGKPAPNHTSYYKKMLKEAGVNSYFLGFIPHDQLPQYYSIAKVHALISWMETTGISSLEAGAMGCNLVITDKGDTRNYFDNYAFYCQPDSIESIKKAINQAYTSPVDPKLRSHIVTNYTWKKRHKKHWKAMK